MSFTNIADYSLKVRRELLWDKWADLASKDQAAQPTTEQVAVPAELAAQVAAAGQASIVEWKLDEAVTAEAQNLESAGCSCGCW